ncbi:MAG: hypothetical protein HEP70_19700 [Rhodobiaceae bacterium]|nr:hypothetical protein [Rhodobiaceae bacterium]
MKTEELAKLVDATRVRYERERALAKPLLVAEARIRGELVRLEIHERSARANADGLQMMRPFGGDVVWTAWTGRQRRALNTELARVLAEKEDVLAQLRLSFGRVRAAEEMRARAEKSQRLDQKRHAAQALFDRFRPQH